MLCILKESSQLNVTVKLIVFIYYLNFSDVRGEGVVFKIRDNPGSGGGEGLKNGHFFRTSLMYGPLHNEHIATYYLFIFKKITEKCKMNIIMFY